MGYMKPRYSNNPKFSVCIVSNESVKANWMLALDFDFY